METPAVRRADPGTDLIDALSAPEPNSSPLPTQARSRSEVRAAIDAELRTDPSRSDREIGRTVGCDHKTVATRRGEIEIPQKPPTATERRNMLINGVKDFDAKHPPQTAEEAVDNAIAAGKVSLAVNDPEEDPDEFRWHDPDERSVVFREQRATAIYFNKANELVIRQQAWPDEDSYIFIGEHLHQAFLDRLCDVLGVQAFGGPKPR
jgi:hypothetical protein